MLAIGLPFFIGPFFLCALVCLALYGMIKLLYQGFCCFFEAAAILMRPLLRLNFQPQADCSERCWQFYALQQRPHYVSVCGGM